ncbi:hypothetical protein DM02DRAFT_183722 [Periconia macrospinosa]|uniref:Uncharacterized protein n=1 Tax=Periconia macrospinosa TaxID=97972 RepID=A0A2V1D908_9PLEO|nr:hypothetical protein DM02DRAFT_183722 [Periconia macrospinosa]
MYIAQVTPVVYLYLPLIWEKLLLTTVCFGTGAMQKWPSCVRPRLTGLLIPSPLLTLQYIVTYYSMSSSNNYGERNGAREQKKKKTCWRMTLNSTAPLGHDPKTYSLSKPRRNSRTTPGFR